MIGCSVLNFPCTYVGASEYYGVDLGDFLLEEGEQLVDLVWEIPEGLIEVDQKLQDNVAYVKLSATSKGSYLIKLTVNSSEGTSTQTTIGKFRIRVES